MLRLFKRQVKSLNPIPCNAHVMEYNLNTIKTKMGAKYIMHPDYKLENNPAHDFWRTSRRA